MGLDDYHAAHRAVWEAEDALRLARIEAERQDLLLWWDGCEPVRAVHPYLASVGLDSLGCDGMRLDPLGRLVVPIWHGRDLVNAECITADGTSSRMCARSVYGAEHRIDRPRATITVICPHVEDALVCYRAIPDARVVVAFGLRNADRIQQASTGMVARTDAPWLEYRLDHIARRAQVPGYATASRIARDVDASIRAAVMQDARWVPK